MFILDREKVFIGSMNLDPRSVAINTEIGVLIESPELANDLLSRYGQGLASACYSVVLEPKNPGKPDGAQQLTWIEIRDGETIRHDQEPQTTFWERFGVGLIGLFPVDSQL
jgi:putative cardiolipin synthase